MKSRIHILMTAAALSAAVPGWAASASSSSSATTEASATQGKDGKESRRELRVLSTTTAERRTGPQRVEVMETVAFLGVETGAVSATLSAQLALQPGTGLVVNHVVPGSPAESALKQHDILQKIDDQVLVESRQLAVLVRGKKEGDEVALTFLRGGKPQTARVKLGKQEAPRLALLSKPDEARVFAFEPGARVELSRPFGAEGEDVDRLLALVPRSSGQETARLRIDGQPGRGWTATRVYAQDSSLVFSDDAGSLKVTTDEGKRTLVAKDAKGDEVFNGPVNTPEEREKMPVELRTRLEKLESMYDVTFKIDGDFRGVERRVIKPKGISLPFAPIERPLLPVGRMPRVL